MREAAGQLFSTRLGIAPCLISQPGGIVASSVEAINTLVEAGLALRADFDFQTRVYSRSDRAQG